MHAAERCNNCGRAAIRADGWFRCKPCRREWCYGTAPKIPASRCIKCGAPSAGIHLCPGEVALPPVPRFVIRYMSELDPAVWGPPPDPAGDLLRGMGIAVSEDDPR